MYIVELTIEVVRMVFLGSLARAIARHDTYQATR